MNIKILSALSFLALAGTSLAQIPGNPFGVLGIDFYGFFLPWLFAFAVAYGLLETVGIFKNKRINSVVAIVFAFFAAAIGGPQIALFFSSLFGGATMILAGVLVIVLFAAMIGVKLNDPKEKKNMIALIVLVIVGIVLFLASSGNFLSVNVIGPDMVGMIFWLIIIVAAFYMVTGEDKSESKKPAAT